MAQPVGVMNASQALAPRMPAPHHKNPGGGAPRPPPPRTVLWALDQPLLLMYASMDLAACLPAPIARMTVAAPVAASPPANTPGRLV